MGLARRLLGSRDADAYAAMGHAALGVACAPLDILLEPSERRLYQAAPAPVLPQLFVCGPPRSGTTLVAQALIAHLPVAWLSNLTAVFPRSPLRAMRLFSRRLPSWRANYRSYYGRSRLLNAPNDSLQIWDRWLGADRTRLRVELTAEEREGMVRFFGALEQLTRYPLVTKNNNLNLQALPVAAALPTARFLVLDREPEFLAQALLVVGEERAALGDDLHGRADHRGPGLRIIDQQDVSPTNVSEIPGDSQAAIRQGLFFFSAPQGMTHLAGFRQQLRCPHPPP